MNNHVKCLVVLCIAVCVSGSASAAIQWEDAPYAYSISQIIDAGGINYADMSFTDWSMTWSGDVDQLNSDALFVFGMTTTPQGATEVLFLSQSYASYDALGQAVVTFKTTTGGQGFGGAGVELVEYGTADDGSVAVLARAYANNPSGGGEPVLGSASTYGDATNDVTRDDFALAGAPTALWFTQTIDIEGPGLQSTDESWIYQYKQSFSPVPEPGTFALLGAGALAMIRRRLRRA